MIMSSIFHIPLIFFALASVLWSVAVEDVFYCAHVCLKAAKWIKVVNTISIDFLSTFP